MMTEQDVHIQAHRPNKNIIFYDKTKKQINRLRGNMSTIMWSLESQ